MNNSDDTIDESNSGSITIKTIKKCMSTKESTNNNNNNNNLILCHREGTITNELGMKQVDLYSSKLQHKSFQDIQENFISINKPDAASEQIKLYSKCIVDNFHEKHPLNDMNCFENKTEIIKYADEIQEYLKKTDLIDNSSESEMKSDSDNITTVYGYSSTDEEQQSSSEKEQINEFDHCSASDDYSESSQKECCDEKSDETDSSNYKEYKKLSEWDYSYRENDERRIYYPDYRIAHSSHRYCVFLRGRIRHIYGGLNKRYFHSVNYNRCIYEDSDSY